MGYVHLSSRRFLWPSPLWPIRLAGKQHLRHPRPNSHRRLPPHLLPCIVVLRRREEDFQTGISDLDLCLAHRTLRLPWTQRICHQSKPQRGRGVPTAGFCRLTSPDCCRVIDFLRHFSDPPPSAPDFATTIGVLPARHRQRIDPPQHLAKQPPVRTRPSRRHHRIVRASDSHHHTSVVPYFHVHQSPALARTPYLRHHGQPRIHRRPQIVNVQVNGGHRTA